MAATSRHFVFRYRSPRHWLDTFRDFYGPVAKAFAAIEPAAREALAADLLALVERYNEAKDGTVVVLDEYLEIVIAKRG